MWGVTPKSELSLTQIALSAFMAGFPIGTYLTPLEYIKCRLQAQHTSGMYISSFDCLRKTLASQGGMRPLFSGWGITLARDMPGNSVYFVTYEAVSDYFSPQKGQPAPINAVIAGGASAGVLY